MNIKDIEEAGRQNASETPASEVNNQDNTTTNEQQVRDSQGGDITNSAQADISNRTNEGQTKSSRRDVIKVKSIIPQQPLKQHEAETQENGGSLEGAGASLTHTQADESAPGTRDAKADVSMPNTLRLQEPQYSAAQPKEVRFSSVPGPGAKGPALPDLAKAHKLAMAHQRKQFGSNSIKGPEGSKQTYNPYHLSSYQQIQEGGDGFEQGSGIRHHVEHKRTGTKASSTVTDEVLQGGSPAARALGSPAKDHKKIWGGQEDDVNRPHAQKKGPHGFSAEVRKQLRKKQEIELINKTSKSMAQGNMAARAPQARQHGLALPPERGTPKVLGVCGERANMTKTLNYGALARQQMLGVEQMERQMLDNIRKFEIKQGLSMNGYNPASVRTAPNRAQQVYWLDRSTQGHPDQGRAPYTSHALPRRPIHGANNFDPNSDYQVKSEAKRTGQNTFGPNTAYCRSANQSKSSRPGQAKAGWRNSNTKESQKSFRNSMSHLSSHRRRKEAQDALEKYVMREEQNPKIIQAAHRNRGQPPYILDSEYVDRATVHQTAPVTVQEMHVMEPDIRHASPTQTATGGDIASREQESLLRRLVGQSDKKRLSGAGNNTQSTLHDPSQQNVEVHVIGVGRASGMNNKDNYVYTPPGQVQLETHGSQPGHRDSTKSGAGGIQVIEEAGGAYSGEGVSKAGQSHPNSKSQGSQRFAIYSAYQTQRIQPKPGSRMKSQRGTHPVPNAAKGGAMRGIGVQGTSAGLQVATPNHGSNMQITNNSVVSQRINNFSQMGQAEGLGAGRGSRSHNKSKSSHGAASKEGQGFRQASNLSHKYSDSRQRDVGDNYPPSMGKTGDYGAIRVPQPAGMPPGAGTGAPRAGNKGEALGRAKEVATAAGSCQTQASPGEPADAVEASRVVVGEEGSRDVGTAEHDGAGRPGLLAAQGVRPGAAGQVLIEVDQAPLPNTMSGGEAGTARHDTLQLHGGQRSVGPSIEHGHAQDSMQSTKKGEGSAGEDYQVQSQISSRRVGALGEEPRHDNNDLPGLVVTGAGILSGAGQPPSDPASAHRVLGARHPGLYYPGAAGPSSDVAHVLANSQLQSTEPPKAAPADLNALDGSKRRSTAPSGAAPRGRRRQGRAHGATAAQRAPQDGPSYERELMNRSCDDPDRILAEYAAGEEDGESKEHGTHSDVAFAVLQEVENAWRRRNELRNVLEVNDRKKLQFAPRPTRFGLKFKNKSEEERYLRICGRVMQMDYMNASQIEQLQEIIRRYLAEYLAHIQTTAAARSNTGAQPFGALPVRHPVVDQRYVGKFIKAIRGLQEQERSQLKAQARRGQAGAAESQGAPGRRGHTSITQATRTAAAASENFGTAFGRHQHEKADDYRSHAVGASVVPGESATARWRQNKTATAKVNPTSLTNFIRQVFGFPVVHTARGQRSVLAPANDTRSISPSQLTGSLEWAGGGADDGDLTSEGPEKWTRDALWPRETWHRCDDALDLASMYDGRRRERCKEVSIPEQVDSRNAELGDYIQKHSKVIQHETALPCILSNNYYRAKQDNYTEKTILNRLQSKQLQKSFTAGGAAQAKQVRGQTLGQQNQRYIDQHPQITTPDHHSYASNSRAARTLASHPLPPSAADSLQAAGAFQRASDSTAGLKTESMIRRNRLTLEHVMHERGRHLAEGKVLADLHRELRHLEAKQKPQHIITVSRGRVSSDQ